MNVTEQQIGEAIDRIARTSDGLALYVYLQKVLCSIPTDIRGDALQAHNGKRMFAAELRDQMHRGVQESHGGTDPSNRPIVFTVREPVGSGRRVGSREYARLVEPGPTDNAE